MNRIIAIVVTYNRANLLLECIKALKQSETKTDILIVDNASTDNTQELVKPFIDDSNAFYVNTGKNLGGAGGFNFGLKVAYEKEYDYFWLMDDDTIVSPNTLTQIMHTRDIVGENFGFISSLALWTDDSVCKMNHHYIANKWNESKKFLISGILEIEIATFVSFFTRREVVKLVGFPIKDYFIWGDDTEYSLRISKSYPSYLSSTSIVHHKMKENQGAANFADFTDEVRIQRMGYAFRNGCFTHRQRGWKKLARHLLTGISLLLTIILKNKSHKCKKIWVILKSYFIGIFLFKPNIEFPTKQ